ACWPNLRSRAAPTVSGFCRHHDRRRNWKCCSILRRKKHLTEKSNLPYKPDSSPGGSRAIQGWTSRISASEGCPHGSRRRSTVDVLPAGGLSFALTHAQVDT